MLRKTPGRCTHDDCPGDVLTLLWDLLVTHERTACMKSVDTLKDTPADWVWVDPLCNTRPILRINSRTIILKNSLLLQLALFKVRYI